MKEITGTTKAWLTCYQGPEDIKGDPDRVIGSIFYSPHNMENQGWTLIGEATITLSVPDEKALVENKVGSLRAEKTKTLADAQAKATEIESKIQKLLAITYEPEAA